MSDNKNNKKINSRFNCLKSSENEGRVNRFKTPQKTNSRWDRSKSPKKGNSFTAKGRDYNRRNFSNRRNFNNRRNDNRRKISEKFNGIEKDSNGRPMIHNATTKSFNLEFALQKSSSPISKKNKKNKKNKINIHSFDNIKPKFVTNEKTKEEIEKEKEWNKQMVLNMQYETDSEQEEEEEEEESEI